MIKPLEHTGTYQTYSMADGLAGMRIEHIAEDSEGCVWFATWDNGVSRFDGNEFQNFTKQDGLIDDRTYFVTQDSQNRLWFGTANGVCWYGRSQIPSSEGRWHCRSRRAEHLRRQRRPCMVLVVPVLWGIAIALLSTT